MALGISGARAGLQDGADEEEEEQELEHGPARIVLVAALDVPRENVRAGELVERVLEAAQRAVQTLHDESERRSRRQEPTSLSVSRT